LPAKNTKGKSLVDYSQSHVVTLKKNLRIMQQKVMDREVAK
jgi:hypothetical protein